ncbi:MAG: hypothetical protein NT159_03685 [Proteobacteria bacterium]|nr:hypothetical protein [Pseudomonadota bacterium]
MDTLSRISFATWLIAATIGSALADNDTQAGRAVNESVQTSGHASASAAHSIAASGQVTFAVSAVPLSVGGAVLGSGGAVSAAAARDSMRAATAPIGTPLKVTDETISVVPPNEALKAKSKATAP